MYKTVYDAWPTSSPPRKITLKEKYVMKTKQFPSKKKTQKTKRPIIFCAPWKLHCQVHMLVIQLMRSYVTRANKKFDWKSYKTKKKLLYKCKII